MRLCVVLVLSVGFAVVAGPIVRGNVWAASFLRQMLVPFAMLVLVLLVAIRHDRRWRRTTAGMAALLEDTKRLRDGERTATQMQEILQACSDNGEMSRLAVAVGRLADEARRANRRVRDLELECQRRVSRTADTLGHEIGVLKTKAGRDGLTNLGNRRALDEALPQHIQSARRAGRELSVVMIDVDHFKPLNDTLGHAAGDAMLKDIARLIRSTVRERSDAAFRYGGDEFVLILDGAGATQARATADRLGKLVDDLARSINVAKPPGLSCGVACLTGDADAAELLAAADADVYRVKRHRKSVRLAA